MYSYFWPQQGYYTQHQTEAQKDFLEDPGTLSTLEQAEESLCLV